MLKTKRRKVLKGLPVLLLALLFLLSACSADLEDMSESANEGAADSSGDVVGYSAKEREQQVEDHDDGEEFGEEFQRRIIQEQYIEQQVQDLQQVLTDIEKRIAQTPGSYIESMSEWQSEGRNKVSHHARLNLRVPTDSFEAFMSQIEEQGNITHRNLTGEDVTEEFYDNESRLRNLKAHEDRILELYEKAETIEDMLKIEQELSRIRDSIERIEGRQKLLRHVTSTVKISLELYQVEEEEMVATSQPSVFSASWAGFKSSLKQLFHFGQQSFIFLITVLPYLVLLSLAIIILLFGVRKMKNDSRNSRHNRFNDHASQHEENKSDNQEHADGINKEKK